MVAANFVARLGLAVVQRSSAGVGFHVGTGVGAVCGMQMADVAPVRKARSLAVAQLGVFVRVAGTRCRSVFVRS